ncbi:MAG: hypothetical protein ACYC8T_25765, partial [Myxococcaceae bacterium]
MTRCAKFLLLLGACLVPLPGFAQSDGSITYIDASLPDAEVFDAAEPDASVGQGGADRDTQENEDSVGRTQLFCRSSKDCDRGFTCKVGRCTYVGYRRADNGGCILGVDAATFFLGLGLAFGRS